MRTVMTDLRLDRLTVLYPGTMRYRIAERVTALPLATLADGNAAAILDPDI